MGTDFASSSIDHTLDPAVLFHANDRRIELLAEAGRPCHRLGKSEYAAYRAERRCCGTQGLKSCGRNVGQLQLSVVG